MQKVVFTEKENIVSVTVWHFRKENCEYVQVTSLILVLRVLNKTAYDWHDINILCETYSPTCGLYWK